MRRAVSLFLALVCVALGPLPCHGGGPAADGADDRALAAHPFWLRLLHYHRDVLWRYRSAIDDRSFFLSPRGHTDPGAELAATLRAFREEHRIDGEPVACRYPARFHWLTEQLGDGSLPQQACPRYDAWRRNLNARSVQLVFASYYLNNPASMYGHTFLKLGRAGYEEGQGLLDYTVNFAAVTDTQSGLLFAVKGLIGGYPGRFSTEPYYMKIQQYNNMESRDLWEYDLDIDQEGVDRLVRHLWEMGPVSMAYFFFNKNCSYQLLPMLEVAAPERSFVKGLRFRAIPLDTMRAVMDEPGMVVGSRLRPSHVRTMLARRALLSDSEIGIAEEIFRGREAGFDGAHALPAHRQGLVLDAAFDLLRYKTGFYRTQPADVMERERRILLARRAVPAMVEEGVPTLRPAPLVDQAGIPPPEAGHNTARSALAFGVTKTGAFQEVSVRAAIHDLEGDPTGFVDGSQLEMLDVRIRHDNRRNQLTLERFTIIDILSLTPWDRWVNPPTWAVRLAVETAHDLGTRPERSLFGGVSGGSGITVWVPGSRAMQVYAMARGESGVGSVFRDDYRAGVGGAAGFRWRQGRRARMHLSASAIRFGMGNPGNKVTLSATQTFNIHRNAEVRLGGHRQNAHQEGTVGLYFYW